LDNIRLIKGSCENKIFSVYPITKQLNINELQGYTQDDKDRMQKFINTCRERSDELESIENITMDQIDYSDIQP
jgi:hypothetical protein